MLAHQTYADTLDVNDTEDLKEIYANVWKQWQALEPEERQQWEQKHKGG